jgi:hypothetical protein
MSVVGTRMRRAGGDGGTDGAATIEFIFLAIVLLVPFVYAVLCVFEVQRAAYALSSATRESGRAFVTASGGDAGAARARDAADLVLRDNGLEQGARPSISCSSDPCLTPGGRVAVALTVQVRLPLLPAWGHGGTGSIRVHAEHVELVDEFREQRP